MTLRTRDRDVAPGDGNPRLVKASDGHVTAGTPEAAGVAESYPLALGVTTIGSADGQDIQLDGLDPQHGEVRREPDGDEFVYHHLSDHGVSQVAGAIVTSADLHHGDRIDVGPWALIYQRDEYADHGRFDGGREGGNPSGPQHAGTGGHESEPGGS